MASITQRSYTGGELNPLLHARSDQEKYSTGMALCQNFMVLPQGGACNRPGMQFLTELWDQGNSARFIPFSFNTEQTYVLVFAHLTMYVLMDGGVVLDDNNDPYVLTTPYAATELDGIGYAQSADVLYVVHNSHPLQKLARSDHADWSLSQPDFMPVQQPPVITSSGFYGKNNTLETTALYDTMTYVITALSEQTAEESTVSASWDQDARVGDNWAAGEYIKLTWDAASGADRYRIYKSKNGVFGFIGETATLAFEDDRIEPDLTDTPPEPVNPFDSAGNYPSVVGFAEQRLLAASTDDRTQTVWMSRTGQFENMATSSPLKDDDAITYTLAGLKVNAVRHILALDGLMMLTSGGVWRAYAGDGGPLTPTTIQVKMHHNMGSAQTPPPMVIGDTLLYVHNQGGRVLSMVYDYAKGEQGGYRPNDRSILSAHLLENHTIVDWSYAQEPHGILWVVRDDGLLLGFTFMDEHLVYAWHQHPTDGMVERVCAIEEGAEHGVYLLIKRTVNGQEKRFIERLHSRTFTDLNDAFFVDSGLSYSGSAVTSISGLDHLEGATVVAVADGGVVENLTVSAGAITLPSAASTVQVGLPYSSAIKKLPLNGGYLHGVSKQVTEVVLDLYQSAGGRVAIEGQDNQIDTSHTLQSYQQVRVTMPANNDLMAQISIIQDQPLPMTLLADSPVFDLGR
ncbi:hypothetical protein [Magnetococcus sp. PR-3]|uniref:hypothetical protein n=1 Tax=Magnetococcus sp. PR-3 TaxID=3120355 RepID=UPI002FCE6708